MDMTHTPVSRLLFKLSPPVMLALLIQSIYNIADSLFVAHYSQEGLTALSIVYPIQLLMVAIATGTGAGVNILIARMDGQGEKTKQSEVVTNGFLLALVHYLMFALGGFFLASAYFHLSSQNALVREQGVIYSRIVFCGSLGAFLEGICTKILQARGNMVLPMAAQVVGAVINILLDPILIFGLFGSHSLGIAGAAIATVTGQLAAMAITMLAVVRNYRFQYCKWSGKMCLQIYRNGIGSIVTQSLYTLYIVGLNMILKTFTEDAVTVLGIYYKVQTFFFIPLLGLQQVLLPVISNNYGAGEKQRICSIVRMSLGLAVGLMLLATIVFMAFPQKLLLLFSSKAEILAIGTYALRVIAISFVPAGVTIVVTTHLQAVARMKASVFIIVLRQVILLVPVAWLLHFCGLNSVWWTFPITECVAALTSGIIEKRKP